MNDEDICEKQQKESLLDLIKSEYSYCFEYLQLYKKDYFAIVGTIIGIIGVLGYSILNKGIVYWIPLSFLLILFCSICLVIYFFYKFFIKERESLPDDEISNVICFDLFYRNIRPIFQAISLLFIINTICLVLIIGGIIDIQNVRDVFLNLFSPGLQYSNISAEMQEATDKAITNLEFVFIITFIFQTLMVTIFTIIIQNLKPPYVASRHLLKIFKKILRLENKNRLDEESIASSIFYIYSKSTPHLIWIGYIIFCVVWGFITISYLSYYMAMPEISLDLSKSISGVLIGLIQLIFFVILFDFFENHQINMHYEEKLQKLNNIRYSLELERIQAPKKNISIGTVVNEYNLLNIFSPKRLNIFPFFKIPTFSTNSVSVNAICLKDLKDFFSFKNEPIIKIIRPWVILVKIITLIIFSSPLVYSIFFGNGYRNPELLSFLFMLNGLVLFFIMILIFPEATSEVK